VASEIFSDAADEAEEGSEEALLSEEPPFLQPVRRSTDIIIAGISLFIIISFEIDVYIISQPM